MKKQNVHVVKMGMLRRMCGVSKNDTIRNELIKIKLRTIAPQKKKKAPKISSFIQDA